MLGPFKKDITMIELALHTKYIDSCLSSYVWTVKKNLGRDSISKWEIVKNSLAYKAAGEYCNLWMKEKLAMTSYNNPHELPNEKIEILNVCMQRISWLLWT